MREQPRFHYEFDFMISRQYEDSENPFREAARVYKAHEGLNEDNFKYGEIPFRGGGNGFFAVYANDGNMEAWNTAEAERDILYETIIRHLGELGVTVSMGLDDPRHDDRDIELYGLEGETIGILSGMSLSSGIPDPRSSRATHWGASPFPEVDLTK